MGSLRAQRIEMARFVRLGPLPCLI
jgi:hypothetical protein